MSEDYNAAQRELEIFVFRKRAVAAEERLQEATDHIRTILAANDEFRAGMPDDWEGDPLQDACQHARVFLSSGK